MEQITKEEKLEKKIVFKNKLKNFVKELSSYISIENGDWTVKGFIDIYKNVYTISSDTKIISKILEIHLFPKILEFAESIDYSIVLAEHQNYYPDLSFINNKDPRIKFAVDLKTTYRDPKFPEHINGFTLGSRGTYFVDRKSTKNIQFPYSDYFGHFCLGIIYTRIDDKNIDETDVYYIKEIKNDIENIIGTRKVTTIKNLRSIVSVIKDFKFFACEKWEIASDRLGSHNTNNIGSITHIDDIVNGKGIFAYLGEEWFDEYWMNYNEIKIIRKGKTKRINRLDEFIKYKKGDKSLINNVKTKRKIE